MVGCNARSGGPIPLRGDAGMLLLLLRGAAVVVQAKQSEGLAVLEPSAEPFAERCSD
jgi:hypothetical protein